MILHLKISAQCTNVANDCDKLEQQDESVIKSGFVQTDAEDVSAKYLLE
ncbi:unnamed protein product, partial [Rotaria sp. Silwood2]